AANTSLLVTGHQYQGDSPPSRRNHEHHLHRKSQDLRENEHEQFCRAQRAGQALQDRKIASQSPRSPAFGAPATSNPASRQPPESLRPGFLHPPFPSAPAKSGDFPNSK